MNKPGNKVNLPWVEKYRPSTLDDLVSHEDIIKTISKFIKEDQVPHLLFYGPPGTGKTSTILACAKQLYKPSQFSSMVLELNASDDRGIGIVRGQILTFASTRTIFKSGFKLIILDEADAMTLDAQNALRRSGMDLIESDGDEEVEKQLKIVILGAKYSGKTSIIRRFCYNEFLNSYVSTIGADFYLKRMDLKSKRKVLLRITDVGGDELFGTMLDKYLFNANAIFLVYDITNKNSFEEINSWIREIQKYIKSPPIIAIIGNKSDLEHQRSVSIQVVSKLMKELNVLSYLMSAKSGENVSLFFLDVVARYLGVHLTRIDKESQIGVVKARLVKEEVPKRVDEKSVNRNTSICLIQ